MQTTVKILHNNQNKMRNFEKIYYSVSPLSIKYFNSIWQTKTGKSIRTLKNRLKQETPDFDDAILFCLVCKVDINLIIKPLQEKYKNVVPFDANLQLTAF